MGGEIEIIWRGIGENAETLLEFLPFGLVFFIFEKKAGKIVKIVVRVEIRREVGIVFGRDF